jgi:hypothetical protein
MTVSADGYDTISQYIRVGEPQANIAVELTKTEETSTEEETTEQESTEKETTEEETTEEETTKEEETTEEKTSEEKTSEEETESTQVASATTGKYKVYIDAPEGVEVYLDGNYIGITPTSFDKVSGSYVISLRKTGYQTRSYTLQIDNEEKDLNYTFSDLIATEE